MTELSGARYRAGFGHYRQQFVYNVQIPRAQEILHVERTVHTAEHLASAMFFLGAPVVRDPAREVVRGGHAARPRSNPGPPSFTRSPPRLRRHGRRPIFWLWPPICGFRHLARSSSAALKTISRHSGISHAAVFALRFEIGAGGASLFVGNDSGPAHMAAAFGVPSVVIFGP